MSVGGAAGFFKDAHIISGMPCVFVSLRVDAIRGFEATFQQSFDFPAPLRSDRQRRRGLPAL